MYNYIRLYTMLYFLEYITHCNPKREGRSDYFKAHTIQINWITFRNIVA